MAQPKIDSRDRAIDFDHHTGIELVLRVDSEGELSGVSLAGSDIDLTELFSAADFRDFDAAIADWLRHEAYADADSLAA